MQFLAKACQQSNALHDAAGYRSYSTDRTPQHVAATGRSTDVLPWQRRVWLLSMLLPRGSLSELICVGRRPPLQIPQLRADSGRDVSPHLEDM